MGISAHSISLADRPVMVIWVTRFRMCRCDRSSVYHVISPDGKIAYQGGIGPLYFDEDEFAQELNKIVPA